MRPTPLYRVYAAATRLVLPFVASAERRKLARAGVAERAGEKLGHATLPRPEGRLIWFHAASVGESLSVLALITRLGEMLPDAEFLITSGTPTSANLVAQRMPPRARHQFGPLDAAASIDRFLDHWRPDAAVFVESELWPQMLWLSHARGIPLALVNARMSDRSLAGWRSRPETAAMVLSVFRLILTQTDLLAAAMIALGAEPSNVRRAPNLKALSAPLPVDDATLKAFRKALGDRPLWVAASTHAGEEGPVLDAHAALMKARPDLCLILAPRHPDRAAEVGALIAERGWPAPRRSAGEAPGSGPVYLADTMGELGTWYALARFAFLGGSLEPVGGHNPFEAAQGGLPVLSGPHTGNFADSFAALTVAGAAITTPDAAALAKAAGTWLDDEDALDAAREAARAFAASETGAIDDVARQLIAALDLDVV